MELMDIAIALGIGLVGGIFSGVLGIGGSAVTIPGMVLLLEVEQHTAQGVALSVVVLTALIGAITHQRQGNVKSNLVLAIAPMAIIFALLGAWGAGMVTAPLLSRIFGALLLVIGGRMLWGGLRCRY
jgi:hypothetical protein